MRQVSDPNSGPRRADALPLLSSTDNVHIRYVRSLQKKRVRYRDKRFVIEGLRLVTHALQRGVRPALAFYTQDFAASIEGGQLVQALATAGSRVWAVSPVVMATLSDTVAPQGIVAVSPMPEPVPTLAQFSTLLLILDNIRDPGNLGTILRTAQATHVDAVLLSEGCVDPYAPKVVRAGMGAHFGLPLFPDLAWPQIEPLIAGKKCLLSEMLGALAPWEVDWTVPLALIVGSESHGVSEEARRLAHGSVRLPMTAEVESLNAAIAAAVLLFEAEHQRHWDSPSPHLPRRE